MMSPVKMENVYASFYISSLKDKMYSIIYMHSKQCPMKTRRTVSEFLECPIANGLISPFLTGT